MSKHMHRLSATAVLFVCSNVILASVDKSDIWGELSMNYSKKVLPPGSDGPVMVSLDVFILSISAISEKTMDFKVNMFIRQRWSDSRLAHNNSDVLRLTSVIDELWLPDLFLANDKISHRAEITVVNAFVNVDTHGNIVYSQRVTSTIACSMNLKHYPFDVQYCPIKFESYGYTTNELVFQWKREEPIELNDEIALPEHKIKNVTQLNCTKTYSTTGSYSCVGLRFQFDRTVNYYIMSLFVPSVLIVVLSWVSFWIDKDSTPGRISLALLTILTMQTQLGSNMSQLPRVSYIKLIDVWLTGCLSFVFAGFLEYALVNKLSTEEKRLKQRQQEAGYGKIGSACDEPLLPNNKTSTACQFDVESKYPQVDREELMMDSKHVSLKSKSNVESCKTGITEVNSNKVIPLGESCCPSLSAADRVDYGSRFAFPAAFALFNIFLWAFLFREKALEDSSQHH